MAVRGERRRSASRAVKWSKIVRGERRRSASRAVKWVSSDGRARAPEAGERFLAAEQGQDLEERR